MIRSVKKGQHVSAISRGVSLLAATSRDMANELGRGYGQLESAARLEQGDQGSDNHASRLVVMVWNSSDLNED